MKCAPTTCQMMFLAAVMFLPAAAGTGLASDAALPGLASSVEASGLGHVVDAMSPLSDIDPAGKVRWLARRGDGRWNRTLGDSRAPRLAWCTLGLLSLTILGLLSFGWRESGGLGETARREGRHAGPLAHLEALLRAWWPVEAPRPRPPKTPALPPSPTFAPAINALNPVGGDRSLPDAMQPCYALCVGLCTGGDVWGIASRA